MPPNPNQPVVRSVTLPTWLNQRVNDQAKTEMTSGAALIRKAVLSYLEAQPLGMACAPLVYRP